jgi:hypothetical protein
MANDLTVWYVAIVQKIRYAACKLRPAAPVQTPVSVSIFVANPIPTAFVTHARVNEKAFMQAFSVMLFLLNDGWSAMTLPRLVMLRAKTTRYRLSVTVIYLAHRSSPGKMPVASYREFCYGVNQLWATRAASCGRIGL